MMAPRVFGASVAIVTYGEEYCHTIRIPGGWRVYDYGKLDEFKRGTGVEFRKTQPETDQYLIATVPSKARGAKPEDYSVNKFWVDLGNSMRVRAAQEDEWKAAPAAPIAGERLEAATAEQRTNDEYIFRGRAFRKSGPKWALSGDDARVSPNARWIAVQSWNGTDYRDGDSVLSIIPPLDISGRFFVDLYDVASGEKLIGLDGIDRDFTTGDAPLHSTFWLDSRYFILPLGTFREKLLVCEVPASLSAPSTAGKQGSQ